jgi:hypothetical protein
MHEEISEWIGLFNQYDSNYTKIMIYLHLCELLPLIST